MTILVGESVVFIDDDEEVRRANAQSLELAGFEVQVFAAAETAQSALSPDFPGVVVTDVRLPRISGLTLLRQLMELDPDLPVILITGHGDIPMAVEAMREGAYDFFEKPYPPDRLIDSVRRAAEKRRLVLENRPCGPSWRTTRPRIPYCWAELRPWRSCDRPWPASPRSTSMS